MNISFQLLELPENEQVVTRQITLLRVEVRLAVHTNVLFNYQT